LRVVLFALGVLFVVSSAHGAKNGGTCSAQLVLQSTRTDFPRQKIAKRLSNRIREEVLSQCEEPKGCSLEQVTEAVGTALTHVQKKFRAIKGISAIVGMYAGVVTVLSYMSLDESFPRYVIAPITLALTPVLSAVTAPVTEWIASKFRHLGFGISTAVDSDLEIDELRKSYESLWKIINAKLSENAQTGRNALNSALTQTMISLDAAWWAWNENTSLSKERAIDLVAFAAIYMRKVFPDLDSNIELVGLIGRVYFSDHLRLMNGQFQKKVLSKIKEHDKKATSTDYYQRLMHRWFS